jgi:hypothetical protein
MQAYRAYYEGGRVIPLGNPLIPEGSEIILTVLEPQTKSRAERQREAFKRFMAAMENSPPLPDEFDEIISQRVNIRREVKL